MNTLFFFIVALGILIFVHELGHFLAARFFGVKVETFSIGFGPKILKFNCCDTEFAVSLIPLGGYVKMSGENPDEPVKHSYDFYAKPPWQRIIIAFAGPLMNLVIAIFFFAATFYMGRAVPTYQLGVAKVGVVASERVPLKPGDVVISVDGIKVKSWNEFSKLIALNPNKELRLKILRNSKEQEITVKTDSDEKNGIGTLKVIPAIKPVIGKVVKGSPAEKAGLRSGDIILSINGKDITTWEQVVETIAKSGGKPVKIKVLRKGKRFTIEVTPQFNKRFNRFTVGIIPKIDTTFVKYPLFESVKKGIEEFISQSKLFFTFLYKLITGQASIKSLGGPIMIAEVAGKAAESGISNFVYFMGFISLQLGYFNLLPLPVLDGGLILLFVVEILRRRPLSVEFRERFQQIGFAILALLMTIVFYNDIMRLIKL